MKFSKKSKIISLVAGIIIILFLLIFFIVRTSISNKTTKIGFYGLPQNVTSALEQEIRKIKPENCSFTIIDSSKPLTSSASNNFTILFAWKDKNIEQLESKLMKFPEEFYEAFPTRIANSAVINQKPLSLPILLDHFEITYYETFRTKANLQIPYSYTNLKTYLEEMKEFAQYPLILAGSNDDTLACFISVLFDSIYGANEYFNLIEQISTMDIEKDELPPKLISVLDEIKLLQNEKFLPSTWQQTQEKDINFFMEEHYIDVICMKLSEHRTKKLNLLLHYEESPFPPENLNIGHVLVAPEVCGVMFKNNNNEQNILKQLISYECQNDLSEQTMLAPTNSRAQSYDKQADDVRYWAAIYPDGPTADIISAAIASPKEKEELMTRIRTYLEK